MESVELAVAAKHLKRLVNPERRRVAQRMFLRRIFSPFALTLEEQVQIMNRKVPHKMVVSEVLLKRTTFLGSRLLAPAPKQIVPAWIDIHHCYQAADRIQEIDLNYRFVYNHIVDGLGYSGKLNVPGGIRSHDLIILR